jgi:hypothetical protein
MVAEYAPDASIPDFMIKSRLRTFASRLSNLNKYLDKIKYGVGYVSEELPQ